MKAEISNTTMKAFEAISDQTIAPGMYMIARLNGRGLVFRDSMTKSMIDVTEHLMTCGFNVTYAHTATSEISLLFDVHENSYHRNGPDIASILAGEASARLTYIMRQFATFDCRVMAFPNRQLVIDYFQWRLAKDSSNAWSYWKTSGDGLREIVTVVDEEIVMDILN